MLDRDLPPSSHVAQPSPAAVPGPVLGSRAALRPIAIASYRAGRFTRSNCPARLLAPPMAAWILSACARKSASTVHTIIPACACDLRCRFTKCRRLSVSTALESADANRNTSSSPNCRLAIPDSANVVTSCPSSRSRNTTGSGKFSFEYSLATTLPHSPWPDATLHRDATSHSATHWRDLRLVTGDRTEGSPLPKPPVGVAPIGPTPERACAQCTPHRLLLPAAIQLRETLRPDPQQRAAESAPSRHVSCRPAVPLLVAPHSYNPLYHTQPQFRTVLRQTAEVAPLPPLLSRRDLEIAKSLQSDEYTLCDVGNFRRPPLHIEPTGEMTCPTGRPA